MRHLGRTARARLVAGVASAVLACSAGFAAAQEREPITIAPQPLESALYDFGGQTGLQVLFAPGLASAKRTSGVSGETDVKLAMARLLQGTGLTYRRDGDMFVIVEGEGASDPQSQGAAGDGAEAGTVEALVVTAQKKEEDIQDVPIAISAFTQQALEQQKIEGGFDLLKAIPNVTFSKNNFTSYNFSIRGIGTKAISATTDPGVAVAFNSTGLIVNRLFEQEYFDIERVEVLRGPQGTLYGRNATGGVINVISAKPDMDAFSGSIKGEVGNYNAKRLAAVVNVPLTDEGTLAVRLAGAMTSRDGYDFNEGTKHAVNGRDLWSARLTIGLEPSENIRANLIWERFNEDDDRSRTGKQLCHRDNGPDVIGSTPTTGGGGGFDLLMRPALFSTGCKAGSLYDEGAFGTPNGLALPFVFGLLVLGSDCLGACTPIYPIGANMPSPGGALPPGYRRYSVLEVQDPYRGLEQSRDLRNITSFRDPVYRAKADIFEFNLDVEIGDLTFVSQTAYTEDSVYSFQDYNRFNTYAIFTDTSKTYSTNPFDYLTDPTPAGMWAGLAPGGVFCDPQLGCSSSLAGFDISQGEAKQFSQEFRLQSSFGGPVDFSVGANYTRFSTDIDYYVMYNLITATALTQPFNGSSDITKCVRYGGLEVGYTIRSIDDPAANCPYIDPNAVESIDGNGHNYFRSKNPYRLQSYAAFGETYWQVADEVKLTLGLRYTKDRKRFIPHPSQVLLSSSFATGGLVNRGYPADPEIKQSWGEVTGRLGVDWTPQTPFTDQTMVYAFYSRGYKGGGANPPSIGLDKRTKAQILGLPPGVGGGIFDVPFLALTAVNYGPTFEPEFVNAFEVGTKNLLMGGGLVFNAHAFYYDYEGYQVSKIVDRTAVNENFDARVWGLEFETFWNPTRDLRINANLGYLDTRIGEGAKSIDIMNRTQGDPDWVVVKPWAQLPSNCVAPRAVVENYLQRSEFVQYYWDICGGWNFLATPAAWFTDPTTGKKYTPLTYPDINGGAGFYQDLEGNELPNSPHWTMNVGAQYGMDFLEDWRVTVRGDAYWQSQSWARVYNYDPYDKLHGWYNVNLSVWIERPEDDLKIELYAKNLLDKTPITDAFLNSDDTALTTNVFVLDPRLIGLSIRKGF